jgi:hypothetical protein
MEWYAQYVAEPIRLFATGESGCADQTADGDYRWQALPGGGHSAVEDARAVICLIRRMAQG